LRVVGIACPVEQSAYLLVGKAVDEARLADEGFTSSFLDLA
jgi:hypothetical protein